VSERQHPARDLDDVVHQRHRLGILAIAAEARRVEFGYLRTQLDLTAGNLSRHISVLSDAGLVEVEKGYEGRRPRTWVRITREGSRALAAEMAALASLVRRHGAAVRPQAAPAGSAEASRSGAGPGAGPGAGLAASSRPARRGPRASATLDR
jgi:DNA-binding MarR family transcriptional regulator